MTHAWLPSLHNPVFLTHVLISLVGKLSQDQVTRSFYDSFYDSYYDSYYDSFCDSFYDSHSH